MSTTIVIDEIKEELKEAKTKTEVSDLIKLYKLHLRDITDPRQKATYTNYIIDIENQNTRNILFGNQSTINSATKNKHTALCTSTTHTDNSNNLSALDQLKASHKLLIETENVADTTLVNLEAQKEKIRAMQSKVKDVDGLLPQARRYIKNMSQWWRG